MGCCKSKAPRDNCSNSGCYNGFIILILYILLAIILGGVIFY